MTMSEKEVAKLTAVQYDSSSDEVFVIFKVTSEEYKNTVMRFARRDDIEIIIRGDRLFAKEEKS